MFKHKTTLVLILAVIAFAMLMVTQGDPFVRSDGFYYYHTAKSIVNEGSFVTEQQPEYWFSTASWAKTIFNDKYVSVASPGTALLNVPALFVAKMLSSHFDFYNDYFIAYNGHTIFDGILLLINATIFFIGALIFIYKTLRFLNFSKKTSIFSIGSVVISSYLLWYVILLPIFTHIYEVFFVSALIYFLLKRNLIGLGISIGFLFLIRPVFLPIILICLMYLTSEYIFKENKIHISKDIAKRFIPVVITLIPFGLVYLLYNYISYGHPFASGYSVTRSETFDFSVFKGLHILLHPQRGWFIYSPIMLFAITGFFVAFKKYRKLCLFSLASIFSLIVIYGFWPNWWGGGSFGSRFLLATVPFCCIGLAFIIKFFNNSKYKNYVLIFFILLTIYSGSILLLYRVSPFNTDFVSPTEYFAHQIEIAKSSSSVKDFVSQNINNTQTGSGFMAIVLGRMDYILIPSSTDNVFDFRVYDPPFSKQEFPQYIESYLVNKSQRTIYKFNLSDTVNRENNAEIDLQEVSINELNVTEFLGVELGNYDLYIQSGKNIQIRGNAKTWNLDEGVYHLL